MNHRLNLEEIDADGAVREAAVAVDGDTRLSFLRKGGLATGAVVSGGAVLSAFAPDALAAGAKGRPPKSFGKGDIGILNYALTLEYLESAFYNEATSKGKVVDAATSRFLARVTADENAHVAALRGALGSKAVKKPKFNFMGTTGDQTMFQKTSAVLENTGVTAYFGQGFNIKSPKVLKTAISILTIEARHAGAIGLINAGNGNGGDISPHGAFDVSATAPKVLAAVKSTGFIVS